MQISWLLVGVLSAAAPGAEEMIGFSPDRVEGQRAFEAALNEAPSAERLEETHEWLGAEPHRASTPGDLRLIERMADEFKKMGLEVEVQWIHAYLPEPVSASVKIISPEEIDLPVAEPSIPEDPFSQHPDLEIGWNAYSGSGEAEGEVVYANYGRKQDFLRLRELGVDVTDKIVIARYGGNYRGYKALFAEAEGAKGLIIYTDPDDSGYRKGMPYPEGGWANAQFIQRGSIKSLDYVGDPLTPGVPAAEKSPRLEPHEASLPTIPVQPIGWGAAEQILERMQGAGVPQEWQGGLPFRYRLTSDGGVRVRLKVEQNRRIAKTANVVATLRGSKYPDEKVIVGCHHDAWGFGAHDPLSGLMLVFECARSFSELAKAGSPPARSIVFAAWGAEEFGIIGSTEWAEANAIDLSEHAIAYINLDAATGGPDFSASCAPLLKTVVLEAAREVPQCDDPESTVFEAWRSRAGAEAAEPSFGDLGGGSDHVAFYCWLAIPSVSLGSGGASGTAYHSNYDNLHWYQKIVGDDYAPALMNTRVCNVLLARLANADVIPLDLRRYGPDLRRHLSNLGRRSNDLGLNIASTHIKLEDLISFIELGAELFHENLERYLTMVPADDPRLELANRDLRLAERLWVVQNGLPGRWFYRNLYAAPDEDSGYSPWMFPGLRHGIEHADERTFVQFTESYVNSMTTIGEYFGKFGQNLLAATREIELMQKQMEMEEGVAPAEPAKH